MLFIFRTPYMKKISTKYYNMFSFWNFDPLPKTLELETRFFPLSIIDIFGKLHRFWFCRSLFLCARFVIHSAYDFSYCCSTSFFSPFIFSLNIHQTQCISDYCKLFIIQNTKYSSFSSLYFLFFICSFHFLDWHDLVRILFSIILLFRFGFSIHTSTFMPHK